MIIRGRRRRPTASMTGDSRLWLGIGLASAVDRDFSQCAQLIDDVEGFLDAGRPQQYRTRTFSLIVPGERTEKLLDLPGTDVQESAEIRRPRIHHDDDLFRTGKRPAPAIDSQQDGRARLHVVVGKVVLESPAYQSEVIEFYESTENLVLCGRRVARGPESVRSGRLLLIRRLV